MNELQNHITFEKHCMSPAIAMSQRCQWNLHDSKWNTLWILTQLEWANYMFM